MQGLFGPPSGDIGGLDYARKLHLRTLQISRLGPSRSPQGCMGEQQTCLRPAQRGEGRGKKKKTYTVDRFSYVV